MSFFNELPMKYLHGVVVVSSLFFFTNPCLADIAKDLKPIDGYMVMAEDNTFVIDLDGEDEIAIGDIFSVTGPGKNLVHPVTQKIIGKLEEVKGVVRVAKIDEGFSYVRPIGDSAKIKRGDPIRRFSSLNAVFWDYDESNRQLYDRLQNTLTSLKWQDYQTAQLNRPAEPSSQTAQNDTLFFIAHKNMLEVRDAHFDLIQNYTLDGVNVAGKAEIGAAPLVSKSRVSPPDQNSVVIVPSPSEKTQPAVVNYGSAEKAAQLLDNTMMADLLQQGDVRLVAATDGKKISVFNADKNLKLLAEGKIRGYGQILALRWWQPEADGPLYLAVLSWTDDKIDSTIFVMKKNRLEVVVSGLDTILGSFDLDNDGRPETLLSQKFEAENFFGRRIKEAYWHDSKLQLKDLSMELPAKFTVIGGQLADLTGDGQPEAAYVRNGTLWVYSGKKRLYVSPKQMGGSLSVLTYKVDPTLVDYRTTSVFFEVTPVAVDVDADGRKELLVVSSNQSSIRAPGFATTIDESRIVIFNFENGTFVKGTVGEPVEAAIQGLDVDDKNVLFVATDIGSSFEQGGSSRLQTLKIAL